MNQLAFRRGDVVEVRSASEILATLDERGRLDELPFMPEMIPYCGKRYTVDRRADKVCDTISSLQSRLIPDAVFLDELRCDGAGHDGCQAACRFYWKEAWLKQFTVGDSAAPVNDSSDDAEALADLLTRHSRSADHDRAQRYLCQATQMVVASKALSTISPGPYLNEFRSGNVTFSTFVRVGARASVAQTLNRLHLLPEVPVKGPSTKSPTTEPLDLQPGEWVRVKTKDEIARTLTISGRNRGLWFDREMLPFCGGTFRVRNRITRIIDESTGEMLELTRDCVTLEGVACSGERSTSRWFCPRAIPCYWRECWLERTEPPEVV